MEYERLMKTYSKIGKDNKFDQAALTWSYRIGFLLFHKQRQEIVLPCNPHSLLKLFASLFKN